MSAIRRPNCVGTALAIRKESGPDAVQAYYAKVISAYEKKRVDQWLLFIQHPLTQRPGPPQWRFMQLIEELFATKPGERS